MTANLSPPHTPPTGTIASPSSAQPQCNWVPVGAVGIEDRPGNEEWEGELFRRPVSKSLLSTPSSSFICCSTVPGLGISKCCFCFAWALSIWGAWRSLQAWSEKGLTPPSRVSHEHHPRHTSWLFPLPGYSLFMTASPQSHVTPASIAPLPLYQFAFVVTVAELVSSLLFGNASPSWPGSLFRGLHFSSVELLHVSKFQ